MFAAVIIVAGCAGCIFVFVIIVLGRGQGGLLETRLGKVATIELEDPSEADLGRPLSDRLFGPLLHAVGQFVLRRTKRAQTERLRFRIVQAGSTMEPERLLAYQTTGLVVGTLLGLGLGLLAGVGILVTLLNTVGGGFVGYRGPSLSLERRVAARSAEIRADLSGRLDLMTIGMEAGLSFDAAFSKVADTKRGILSQEFQKTLNEMRLGRPRTEALNALAQRNAVEELTMFVQGVVQATPLGVSVAGVLRVQSDEMRRRRRQRAELAGHQAPIKMLLPMMGCIFPTIFMILLGPAALGVLDSLSK